jgi:polysaccharide biosynthesis/export protein
MLKQIAQPTIVAVGMGCVLSLTIPAFGQVGAVTARSGTTARTVPNPDSIATADYVIGADDVLSIVFWRDEQLSREVLVRPDGKISVPLLDDVQAAGLTPQELRDRLSEKAQRFVTDAKVTVVVKAINSRRAYITGQVARPGQYPLASSMSVVQLIATAGGLTDFAKSKDIRVVRVEQGRSINIPFNYDDVTKNLTSSQNIELKPGDTVIVP